MKIKYLILFYLFISIGYGQAVIQSQVLDFDTKQPLSMANIRIIGTTQGTISNINGKFKIAISALNTKISISYIGYETQVFFLDKVPDIVYLKINTLEEIIIMPDSILRILLKNAYQSIEKNYTQQRTMLSGFYRETVEDLSESKFYYYSENLIDIIKPPYKSKYSDEMGQVRVNKSRTVKLPDYESLNVKFYGGTYAPILRDIVQRKNDVLKPEKYLYYHHTLKKILKYDGRDTYQIEIIPKKDTSIVCNLFIDKESMAYSKIEIIKSSGVKDNETIKITLIFEKNGELWTLKAFQGIQQNCKLLEKRLKLTAEFVTTKFVNDEVEDFSFDQQLNYNESIAEVIKQSEMNFQEDFQGVLAPDLVKGQFKSFYSPTFIDTLQSKVFFKVTSSDIANSVSKIPTFKSVMKRVMSNSKFNLFSFYLTPFIVKKSLYSLEIPSLNIVENASRENSFFMTWNMIYKYKINKRWSMNYIFSLIDISSWFTVNGYRLRLGEFGVRYLGVINKSSKPIEIMPTFGVLKNSYWVPLNTIRNNFNFSELTHLKIDAEKVKLSFIERSVNFKVGVDFNFMPNTTYPNRRVKLGIHYSTPIFYSGQKVKIEEVEKKYLKFNKSFEVPIENPNIRAAGHDKFTAFPATIWCHFSYNWGL